MGHRCWELCFYFWDPSGPYWVDQREGNWLLITRVRMEGSLCLNQDTILLINKGCACFSLTKNVPTCFPVLCSLNSKVITNPEASTWICYQSVMVQNGEIGFFQAMVVMLINQPCSVTKWFSSDWNFLVPRLVISVPPSLVSVSPLFPSFYMGHFPTANTTKFLLF